MGSVGMVSRGTMVMGSVGVVSRGTMVMGSVEMVLLAMVVILVVGAWWLVLGSKPRVVT